MKATTGSGAGVLEQEIAVEQGEVTIMYERLDVLREKARGELGRVQVEETTGTDQARSERESFTDLFSGRFSQLSAVERGLCFGRIDETAGDRFHIGRIGLFDDDYNPLLIDWRTPVAQVFYRATAAEPLGVKRRRHIRLHGRTVVGVDDDLLDADAIDDGERSTLIGEAALLSSLSASRTGRMNEIVATIQSEQDEIIRSGLPGVLVVQGGPGTGKTVVALHRAAYLLYTHREQLGRSGVLVVGPNSTFLRYIDQVLPSLGETDVVLATVSEMFPGVAATAPEPAVAARIKGNLAMADVIAQAIAGFRVVPAEPIRLKVNQDELVLRPDAIRKAQQGALAAQPLHNRARPLFVRRVLKILTKQVVDRIGRQYVGDADIEDIQQELFDDDRVLELLDQLWPELTPQLLVSVLFSSDDRLAAAAPHLSASERSAVLRPLAADWTASDVALLDEAAELLGETADVVAGRKRRAAEDAAAEEAGREYAHGIVDIELTAERITIEPWEIEQFKDLIAQRTRVFNRPASSAEGTAYDRNWVFGHVIVDEAQELSAMDWRMLMRRCPRRSMTIVGDIAQTGSAAGVRSWAELLDRYAARRWRTAELTVNYRTPSEIMAVAGDVLAAIDPTLQPPTSVRETGTRPLLRNVPPDELPDAVRTAVKSEREHIGDGRLAVIVPASRYGEFAAVLPEVAHSHDPSVLDGTVALLDVAQSKGLEFDAVLIADPATIVQESDRGLSDLYVAITRATKHLTILGELPDVLG
ncbi:DNA helicase IV [Kribbella pratensis]|uniref:DNA helicase IV n=1 Tax=Kribbella pratensis TaxID=2512112 RepID=A0ABY2F6C8_9ACTN|nr:ATP-binding domain-containing protein [Kribbella pratensis]TDW83928.1 DNA helicase IV [Kribbella pratensis]